MKTRGFTLIELLVVISIIGVLATIVLSSLSQAREKGKNARYFVEVKQLQTALELYHVDNGEYPQASAYFSHNTNAAPANTFIAEMEPYFDVQAFIDDLPDYVMGSCTNAWCFSYVINNGNICGGSSDWYNFGYETLTSDGIVPLNEKYIISPPGYSGDRNYHCIMPAGIDPRYPYSN